MNWAHICVDMQRLFAEQTDWHTPWASRIMPNVVALSRAHPDRTVFTRFVPVRTPSEAQGAWREYYERWRSMTLERLGEAMVDLVPELRPFAETGVVVDKTVYSPWLTPGLETVLRRWRSDVLAVSGGEADVCVLSTVLGAVDRGFHVVVVQDALCSSSDETHDALMTLYESRYSRQITVLETEEALERWGCAPKEPRRRTSRNLSNA